MSETPVSGNGSDEYGSSPADNLNDSLIAFLQCVHTAVPDVCTSSVTIGQSYVPFDPDEDEDCDADEAVCSQLWVRVMNVTPLFQQASFAGGDGCSTSLQLTLEVGILRCIEIPEGGEAPSATDVLVASQIAMDDMMAIHCAATECDVFDSISTGQWSPSGPLGGQFGGIWTFTVEV